MSDLAAQYPQYGWDRNAGYPTPAHLAAIKEHGINEHYRKTFSPIKSVLDK
jgi:ribonuclease HII